jgi:hypothetical protein
MADSFIFSHSCDLVGVRQRRFHVPAKAESLLLSIVEKVEQIQEQNLPVVLVGGASWNDFIEIENALEDCGDERAFGLDFDAEHGVVAIVEWPSNVRFREHWLLLVSHRYEFRSIKLPSNRSFTTCTGMHPFATIVDYVLTAIRRTTAGLTSRSVQRTIPSHLRINPEFMRPRVRSSSRLRLLSPWITSAVSMQRLAG